MIVLIFSLSIILYLLTTAFTHLWLSYALSIMAVVAILISFRHVRGIVQILSGILLVIGFVVMLANGAGILDILKSFGYMMNILTLFALVPLMAIPMRTGRYGEDIQRLISSQVKSSGSLYVLTSGLAHFLGIFTYLASLPMTYYAIRPSADGYPIHDKERFMSRAITHGFSMTTMWTPIAPILATVLEMTKVSWASIVLYVLILAFLGLLVDWIFGMVIAKRNRMNTEVGSAQQELAATGVGEGSRSGKVWHVVFAIIILSLLILVMELTLSMTFMMIIIILIVPFGLIWSVLIGKGKEFWQEAKKHPSGYLPKMKDQFVIFLSAGFMITALRWSGTDTVINLAISDFKDLVGVHVFIVLIPLIPLGLAFIGLHPAVALALVAQSLDAQLLGISPQLISVAMLAGAATSFLMGPYNATIGMMAGIVNRSPFQVSNWNFPYTIAFILVAMCFLVVLQFLI
ncbi:hypothetical protein [Ammoniphilus sp. CFH 90114]|uniref:hypothetical protein n=1 Tax=Ammoniphilus sp. CFH 90114 TaxID=2493665 RepID=UPI00100FF4A6|nr:hypothetical protein [Ammoniphilus sp. CFH 90114]RXT06580.1 hypothetical protein EIZ39_16095 [Ammoniphilus sp. CFH 90114]